MTNKKRHEFVKHYGERKLHKECFKKKTNEISLKKLSIRKLMPQSKKDEKVMQVRYPEITIKTTCGEYFNLKLKENNYYILGKEN